MTAALEEQQRITSDLERSVAENNRNDSDLSNGDEEAQRLANQIAIMNTRIQQLEIQEQERQSTIVDFLPPPPMYSSARQSRVNQEAAAFVMHEPARTSAGVDVADINT